MGKSHRCVGNAKVTGMANSLPDMANTMANSEHDMANTYRYRDKARRQAYMRDYMRRVRSNRKGVGGEEKDPYPAKVALA